MGLQPKRKPRLGIDEYGRSPLWCFAEKGDLPSVLRELIAGADPNVGDDAGYTPLHCAVQHGHLEIIDVLLSHDININLVDKHGNSSLWTAILSSPSEHRIFIMQKLYSAGADPFSINKYGRSPYDLANEIGHGLEKIFLKPHLA